MTPCFQVQSEMPYNPQFQLQDANGSLQIDYSEKKLFFRQHDPVRHEDADAQLDDRPLLVSSLTVSCPTLEN